MKRTNIALITVAAVIIAAALVVSFVTLDDGTDDPSDDRFVVNLIPVTDEMLDWSTPEEARDQLDEAVDSYLEAASAADADMASAIDDLYAAFADLERQYTVFDWDYSRDPDAYSEYYTDWTSIYDTLEDTWDEALRESLQGVNGDAVREVIGDDEADRILSSGSVSEELQELVSLEAELINLYYGYDGDDTGYYAEILLELVDVRNSIAAYYGYENYVDYAYAEVYGRDYTPDEADAAKDAVKEYVIEVYTGIDVDYDAFYELFTYTEQDELLDFVEPFIDSICPEFAEVYDYMREYGLIDFEYLDTKISGAYSYWNAYFAYIFDNPYLDAYDVRTLLHEFGHATNFYLNDLTSTDDYDISEIHSQGLELILALDPGILFEDGGELYTAVVLKNIMWNVIAGCFIDDFEKALYYGEVTTAEEMEELWDRLLTEYGRDPDGWYDWYEVQHIFASPCYYISYGVSAFSALEIFVLGLEDYDAAVDLYLDVVAYTDSGINAMTEALGMMSFFDGDDIASLIQAIQALIAEPSDGRFDYTLVPVTDEMLSWSSPEDARDQMDEAVDAVLSASSAEEMEAAVLALDDELTDIQRQYVIFYWDYCRGESSTSGLYTDWTSLFDSVVNVWDDTLREVLRGDYGDTVRELIGDEEADRILSTDSTPEELEELLAAEAELEDAYNSYAGDADGYAEIMLELVDVRNAIAEYYGYDNYVDYAYAEVYYRDYTPDEADAAKDAVKEYVSDLYNDIEVDYYAFYELFTYTEQDELLDFVEPFIDSICPEFAEVYDYMREYGLIDFEDLDTKIDSGYTYWNTYFAYIFDKPYMDAYDVCTLVHEFGHAANYYLNDHLYYDDVDISEVLSQGLELILALDPGILFEDGGELYTAVLLKDTVSSILSACFIDDFEKALYYGEVTTAEEMEELWDRLMADYGRDPSGWYDWYEIPHIFASPCYYISYGVSAFSALEIFVLGIDDYDAAVDLYLDVVAYTDFGINGMTEALGMMSFFDEEDVAALAEALWEYVGSLRDGTEQPDRIS